MFVGRYVSSGKYPWDASRVASPSGEPPGSRPRAHLAGGELTGGKCVKFGDSFSTGLTMHDRYLVGIDPTELAR